MFKIPFCFKDKGEYYLTNGPLQVFCKKHNLRTNEDRVELINYIEDFANLSEENEIIVLEWLEGILKEGVKHVYVRKCFFPPMLEECPQDMLEKFIETKMGEIEEVYIIGADHSHKPKCLNYTYEYDNDKVSKISFTYSVKLAELKQGKTSHNKIIYPIFIDIDFKNKLIIGRAKSKNGIYEFIKKEDGTLIPSLEKVNTFKFVTKLMNEVAVKLEIVLESKEKSKHIWSSHFYDLINECTETPKEIKSAIVKENQNIEDFIRNFFNRHSISLISKDNYEKAQEDIRLFMEKYLAVNLNDEEVFKKNRAAYPIKIAATDTDLTSVEQCTAQRRPLQASPVFYDNKKILLRRKQCDKTSLVFKRKKQTYITNDEFVITLEVKGGYCVIQTVSYLLEEDIQDVLLRIIRAK